MGDNLQMGESMIMKKAENMGIDFIERLKNKEGRAIYLLYRECFASIEKYILLNSGVKEDAEDVFQEAVMILLIQVSKPDFELTAHLKTYMFAICKNLWLKQLRKKAKIQAISEEMPYQQDFLALQDELEKTEQKWQSIPVVLKRVTAHCSALLKDLFLTGTIPDHYKNDHSLRNQKYKCLEQARKVVSKINLTMG